MKGRAWRQSAIRFPSPICAMEIEPRDVEPLGDHDGFSRGSQQIRSTLLVGQPSPDIAGLGGKVAPLSASAAMSWRAQSQISTMKPAASIARTRSSGGSVLNSISLHAARGSGTPAKRPSVMRGAGRKRDEFAGPGRLLGGICQNQRANAVVLIC